MKNLEFRTAASARGGLVVMAKVPGVAAGTRVSLRDHAGRGRNGLVIRTSDDAVLVEVFEGTDDLDLERTWVRFLDEPYSLPVSRDILGRVFNGVGQPRDGRPPIVSGQRRDINGAPLNPAARAYPREFIQTGLSAVDGMNSLTRGQKLPIFSGGGLPHNRVAAQIVRQARLLGAATTEFVVVFAAFGVSSQDARYFQESFEESGALERLVMFLNLADEPVIERLLTPRAAFTAAEYLAYELDYHVLVVMTDMTAYAEALREVAVLRGDVPARKGYPGYLYSDLAEIYERAGRIRDRRGSITLIPVLSMPSDDITHPIPDLTGYITEGQIVLSRELHAQGVYPPVAVLPSLSRLMKDGIGGDFTRPDHPHVASQLFASYARALEVRGLAAIIGAEDLSESDRRYLAFAEAFEHRFVGQGEDEERDVYASLDLAWELLSMLPAGTLTRVSEDELAKYHKPAEAAR
ncbi:V-type ATP synthase subunit B [Parasulfuritortus cantonensis]|uniref:V-type ATP synthase beta chain n=1 Tax=Parasulfuritortus cantonensis TaxID=2528202 RepID=A0A4R1BKS5_9PROT|nr:V-type ATP synthase subunit B [Parasulfuritortus cantonensis]TCJ18001.1 V-type ATP synthase subunit B [Parasulfuritortus cantonensis]